MLKVLVTGAGALLGQGIIRSLRECAPRPYVIAVDPSPLGVGLCWADEAHVVPLATDAAYHDAVGALIERSRPDVLMVGTDVELHFFARHRAALEQTFGVKVLVSDAEVVSIADDKYLTFQFLERHGFPCPDSALPDQVEALISRVGFPLIVKPRVGARSIGVSLVKGPDELRAAMERVHAPVIQEAVGSADTEYTAGAICFEGRSRASIVMRRDLRDGNTYRAYVDAYPELNRYVRDVADALKPHGPANFQFRLDAAGRPKIFEINGRFSGTTPLRMRAGFNEVQMCLRYLAGGATEFAYEVEPMTILRYWSETVVPDARLAALRPKTG